MDAGADHRRIAAVLKALNAEVLHANVCLLSGNTAIVLRCGGYRESIDIHCVVCKGVLKELELGWPFAVHASRGTGTACQVPE